MLLGPVFRAELLRAPRRRRYFVLRVVYGLFLLMLIYMIYLELWRDTSLRGGVLSIAETANFSIGVFSWLTYLQLFTILLLVPALLGGVIADEKQRKTMHYLMASELSSGEIVIDKLLARLLHIGVFLLLGLPIVSFLYLFGGVDRTMMLGAYVGTLSTTFFVASLSTLISTVVRRVGQGVLLAYLMVAAWLIVPVVAEMLCRFAFPETYAWFGPINAWALATNPVYLLEDVAPALGRRSIGAMETLLWMVGLQVLAGGVFLLVAIRQLRPIFRRQESSSRRLTWFAPGRAPRVRWLRRPDCNGDAMIWKERYFARTDIFTKMIMLPATVILAVCLILGGDFDELFIKSIQDLYQNGYSVHSGPREALNVSLRFMSPFYIGLWLLAVAGASASSLTGEREDDTWISLVSTPLTGWEILRGKFIGTLWNLRGFGLLLLLFWMVGLITGAIHPVSLVFAMLVVGLLTWTVAALGISISLVAKSSSRSLTLTLGTLIVLNGGYFVIVFPLVSLLNNEWNRENLYVSCTPFLASSLLLSPRQVALLSLSPEGASLFVGPTPGYLISVVLMLTAYASAAILLTRQAVSRFDVVLDRPR